jgi:hypothetical protein
MLRNPMTTDAAMHDLEAANLLARLSGELNNFEDIVKYILAQPGDVPRLDVSYATMGSLGRMMCRAI